MLSKIKVVLVGALAAVLVLGAAAPAFAQAETQATSSAAAQARWAGGQVTAVGADSFTAIGLRGKERVLAVTADTQFLTAEGQPSSLADLHVGDRVRGSLDVAEDGTLTALLVINLGPQTEYRGVGLGGSVDDAEQSFVFTSRRGRVWEFYVDDATEITNRAGADLTFADIDTGDRLFVHAELRADGQWWALRVGLQLQK